VQRLRHPPEAQDPRHRLRRQAGLVAEARREVAPAPADLLGECRDRHRAVARVQPRPCMLELGRDGRGGAEALQQHDVQQGKALLPPRRVVQAVDQVRGACAEDVLERDDAPRQLAHRQPEQAACPERGEIDLNAALLAGVLRDCRAVVEASDERAVAHAVDDQRRPEAQDQRDSGERHLQAAHRGARVCAVAEVGQDAAAQAQIWRAADGLPQVRLGGPHRATPTAPARRR